MKTVQKYQRHCPNSRLYVRTYPMPLAKSRRVTRKYKWAYIMRVLNYNIHIPFDYCQAEWTQYAHQFDRAPQQ